MLPGTDFIADIRYQAFLWDIQQIVFSGTYRIFQYM